MILPSSTITAGGGRRYGLLRSLDSPGVWLAARFHPDGTVHKVQLELVERLGSLPQAQVRALAVTSRRLADTHHPGLGIVLDVVDVDGKPALITAHQRGEWLASLVDGPVTPDAVAGLGARVASALAAAHALDPPVAHGALQDDTVWVCPDSRLVVRGFGRSTHDDDATPADDVAALAGLMFELLTDQPRPDTTAGEQDLTDALDALDALDSRVPSLLRGVIIAGLNPDPEARPTAQAIDDACRAAARDTAWQAWVAVALSASGPADFEDESDAPTVVMLHPGLPQVEEEPTQEAPAVGVQAVLAVRPRRPDDDVKPERAPTPPRQVPPSPPRRSRLGMAAWAAAALLGIGVAGWWSIFRAPVAWSIEPPASARSALPTAQVDASRTAASVSASPSRSEPIPVRQRLPTKVVVDVAGANRVSIECGGAQNSGTDSATLRSPRASTCRVKASFDDGSASALVKLGSNATIRCERDSYMLDCS